MPFADAMLVPLPDGVEPTAAASAADNLADAYRHVVPHVPALLDQDPNAHVIVVSGTARSKFSAGLPLYTGLLARTFGAKNVWFADGRPHVRQHAERLGLHPVTPRELRGLPPAPLVLDVSAHSAGLKLAVSMTSGNGTCSSTGNLHRSTALPSMHMYVRNIRLMFGRPHVRPALPEILDLISTRRLHPELVTTTVAPLDDAPAVLREHYTGGGVKTLLVSD